VRTLTVLGDGKSNLSESAPTKSAKRSRRRRGLQKETWEQLYLLGVDGTVGYQSDLFDILTWLRFLDIRVTPTDD